ncbi:two-component regulator propeller domain-containing protein [Silvibacterium sp.]|uniref:sensor histidine kinase n=1 Tax=Silvibacterium sp. TaxID=1964179 RepID=UPI0039E5BCA1
MLLCLLLAAALSPWRARALDPHQPPRHYGYQSWQTDSGLPQNTVHAIAQDRQGYLWIATEAGLVRFDGAQFRIFTQQDTPALGSDIIDSLCLDRDGWLWIGTSQGVARYRDGRFASSAQIAGEVVAPVPARSAIWRIAQDAGGRIWLLTSAGLESYDGHGFAQADGVPPLDEDATMVVGVQGDLWLSTMQGLAYTAAGSIHFRIAGIPSSGAASAIHALAVDSHGQAWAAVSAGVEICAASDCRMLEAASPLGNVHAIAFDAEGRAWLGADNGLAMYDGRTLTRWSTGEGLPAARVERLFFDREGALWIATPVGPARFYRGRLEAMPAHEGLVGGSLLSWLEDREGNLWLGSESAGVTVLRDRAFTTWDMASGLSSDHIRAVAGDQGGTLWLGTDGGGLNQRHVDAQGRISFTALTTAQGLSSNIVLSIAAAPDGSLWLGTPDGLNHIENGRVTRVFTSADGLADDFVRSIYFDREGNEWIGTRRGLSRWKDGVFTTWTSLDGLGSDLVGAMVEDREGALWIATLGGLTRFAHGSFHNFTPQDGLSSRVITALHEDAQGDLWIGTAGGGIDLLHDGRFYAARGRVPLSPRSAALPDDVAGLLEDAAGGLWISSGQGIFHVERDALAAALESAHPAPVTVEGYGVADGLRVREASSGGHPAAWRMPDGTLWFATPKGVATADPAHLARNPTPPLVAIEQVSIDDVPQIATDAVTIPAGRRRVEIAYAALSFAAPQKVRFAYRLAGFDRSWIDAGSRRVAYYTNLPPGHYRFEVQAWNNSGVPGAAPAVLALRMRPYFYQTLWFYLLLALAAALAAYGIYLARLRQIESRFQVVLAERNRIAREIHDTLAQGLVGVNMQLQVAGRLLAASPEVAKQHLAQAQELVRTGLEDARRAIWELRSQAETESDFASRLLRTVQQTANGSGVETQVLVLGSYRPLSAQMESELLRIAQEAVTNAVRHAQAAKIEVTLRYAERQAALTIEDNGLGFASAEQPLQQAHSPKNGHYGLTGIRERAQRIGGRAVVESHPGRGTTIRVELPLRGVPAKDGAGSKEIAAGEKVEKENHG